MNSSIEAELLRAIRRGDRSAFDRFYDRHVEAVYHFALRKLGSESQLGSEDEAMTVTQEVFLSAWHHRGDLQLVDGSARTWLLRSAQFKVWDSLQRSGHRPVVEALPADESTISDMGQTESDLDERLDARKRLREVGVEIELLAPIDQRVFFAAVVDGHTAEEAAKRLNLSVPSVRKRLHRIRLQLRGRLAPGDD